MSDANMGKDARPPPLERDVLNVHAGCARSDEAPRERGFGDGLVDKGKSILTRDGGFRLYLDGADVMPAMRSRTGLGSTLDCRC
jgi:hypothetical protein